MVWKSKYRKSKSNEYQSTGFMFDYYVKLLISLCVNLLAMNIVYVVFSRVKWNENLVGCMFCGVLLHFSLLSSFGWMLCFAILQYLSFNKVLIVINNYFLKSTIFSLGTFEFLFFFIASFKN
jgi:hypothetical protein